MVRRNQAYKYETPFQGSYEIVRTCTNGTTTIRRGAVTARINIRRIKYYHNLDLD